MRFTRRETKQNRRRAAAAVMVVVTVPVLIGMAALTVDVAVMYNTRADLQRTADAAALAGASSLLTDAMLKIRMEWADASPAEVVNIAAVRAAALAMVNPSLGTETTLVNDADIQVGYLDLSSPTSTLVLNPVAPEHLNAVQVTVRRTADSANGSVGFFFAPIFGAMSTDITATATAAFDNRVAGYDAYGGWLLPFTIDEKNYEDQLAAGPDQYEYDYDADTVRSGPDGILEVNLYPVDSGPGNFGLLDIPGSTPPDTPTVAAQIEEGVEPDDLVEDFGGTEITFLDGDGNPVTYTLSGNPGLVAALQSSVETRVGQVIGFLLHDKNGIVDNGSTLTYPIVALRFGRVLDVRLGGGNKYIWIQPATYSGGGVRLRKDGYTSLHDTAGLVVLAR